MILEIKRVSRVAIGKRLRFDVFKRDGFQCGYCGAHPPEAVLECDHIIPVADGGDNDINNLITACFACNRGKADIPLSQVPMTLAEKAAIVAEREEQIAGYEAVMKAKRLRIERDADTVMDFFCTMYSRSGVPWAHYNGMKMFVDRLGLDDTLDAAERAFGQYQYNYQKGFKYFCGICWRKIKEAI